MTSTQKKNMHPYVYCHATHLLAVRKPPTPPLPPLLNHLSIHYASFIFLNYGKDYKHIFSPFKTIKRLGSLCLYETSASTVVVVDSLLPVFFALLTFF